MIKRGRYRIVRSRIFLNCCITIITNRKTSKSSQRKWHMIYWNKKKESCKVPSIWIVFLITFRKFFAFLIRCSLTTAWSYVVITKYLLRLAKNSRSRLEKAMDSEIELVYKIRRTFLFEYCSIFWIMLLVYCRVVFLPVYLMKGLLFLIYNSWLKKFASLSLIFVFKLIGAATIGGGLSVAAFVRFCSDKFAFAVVNANYAYTQWPISR